MMTTVVGWRASRLCQLSGHSLPRYVAARTHS